MYRITPVGYFSIYILQVENKVFSYLRWLWSPIIEDLFWLATWAFWWCQLHTPTVHTWDLTVSTKITFYGGNEDKTGRAGHEDRHLRGREEVENNLNCSPYWSTTMLPLLPVLKYYTAFLARLCIQVPGSLIFHCKSCMGNHGKVELEGTLGDH